MVPLYSFLMMLSYEIVRKRCHFRSSRDIFLTFWLLCSAATLVLTPLFEMRYFVVPWVFMTIEMKQSARVAWSTYLYYGALNAVVLYVFVKRPFVNVFMDNEISRFWW